MWALAIVDGPALFLVILGSVRVPRVQQCDKILEAHRHPQAIDKELSRGTFTVDLHEVYAKFITEGTAIVWSRGWRGKGKKKKTTFRPLGFLRSDLRKPSGRNVVFFFFLFPFTLYFILWRNGKMAWSAKNRFVGYWFWLLRNSTGLRKVGKILRQSNWVSYQTLFQ